MQRHMQHTTQDTERRRNKTKISINTENQNDEKHRPTKRQGVTTGTREGNPVPESYRIPVNHKLVIIDGVVNFAFEWSEA